MQLAGARMERGKAFTAMRVVRRRRAGLTGLSAMLRLIGAGRAKELNIQSSNEQIPIDSLNANNAEQDTQITKVLRWIFRVDVLTFIAYVVTVFIMWRQLEETKGSSTQEERRVNAAETAAKSAELLSENSSKRIDQIRQELDYIKLIAQSAENSADYARRTAKAAEDNLIISRARISTNSHLVPERFEGSPDHITLSVNVKNTGLSPAYNVTVIRGAKLLSHEPGPEDHIQDLDVSLINYQVLQNNTYNHEEFKESTISVPIKEIKAALHGMSGDSRYYLYGYVIYNTSSEPERRLYKRFCDGFFADKKVSQGKVNYEFGWAACQKYNDGN